MEVSPVVVLHHLLLTICSFLIVIEYLTILLIVLRNSLVVNLIVAPLYFHPYRPVER